ncbi:MAG TPA: tetratricopeptide repeat protein [Dongiaceae bacterium]|nr:tetratricopeptide repeat protein [Dongiaceae bacterium]
MKRPKSPIVGVLLVSIALLLPAISAARASEPNTLLGALEQIESESGGLCDAPAGDASLEATIAALLDSVDASGTPLRDSPFPVEALNEIVFRRLGIKASRDIHNPCNLLPSAVLARREGYCVGIAAIYLILAEQLNLPVHAVAIPSHVYLRYDDGRSRIDIETLALGAPTPEGLAEVTAPSSATARGRVAFPRDLDRDQFLAQVHNNLGVIRSERSDHEHAALEYQKALDLDPLFSAAWYNWGNDLFIGGRYREAIGKLNEALRLYPVDTWALNNRGRAWAALGKTSKARKDFEAALAIDPEFRPARRNLAALDAKPRTGAAPSR